LRVHLREQQVGSDVHYPIPDYRQPLCAALHSELRLPHTELLASEILTLPCYPEMSDEEAGLVIAAVNGWQA
jgi:dTDP-4-amino-4,6-dideoxygalactose transaminase